MPKIKKPSKKFIVGALFVSLALIVAGYFFIKPKGKVGDKPTNEPQSFINYNPPTEQEAKSGDEKKPEIIKQEEARASVQSTTGSGKRSVSPIITYASQYDRDIEIGGYVGGVFEDGGSCTATITKDNRMETKTVLAVKGANSVDCPVMSIPALSLTKGTWNAVITYSSTTSEGKSEGRAFEVK